MGKSIRQQCTLLLTFAQTQIIPFLSKERLKLLRAFAASLDPMDDLSRRPPPGNQVQDAPT